MFKPVYVSRPVRNNRKFCCHKCGHEFEKQESKRKSLADPRICKVC